MVARTILLVALAAFIGSGILRADDAPRLSGSTVKIEDAVLKANAIFVGTVIELGTKEPTTSTTPPDGPRYDRVKIKVLAVFRGTVANQTTVAIFIDMAVGREELYKKSGSYIFFVSKNDYVSYIQPSDPYFVLKLLPATDDNIKAVKKLMAK